MNILLIGGIAESDNQAITFLHSFASELVDRGHKLLGGCRNTMDQVIAAQVHDLVVKKGLDPTEYIISYVGQDRPPVHEYGRIFQSRIPSWNSLASPGLEVPETIQEADVVFVLSGKEGTKCAANWARIARKPILPITNFGGAAKEIYEEELTQLDKHKRTRLDRNEFELLNQYATNMTKVAKDAISLAARAILSNEVFIVMSFSDDPKWADVADTFKQACSASGFESIRVDESNTTGRIIPEIIEGIRDAAFIIADISEPKPNVYYELGLAQGYQKEIILTAEKGTDLPFDINDMPTIFWESQKELRTKLQDKIKVISKKFGR